MGTILIVDDDPVFSAVLEDRLHVAGNEVEVLRDRSRTVQAAVDSPLDLVIVEIGQPGNTGLDVVSALRRRPETRALPILVLSESVESSDRVAALRAGADDYLMKPCDLEELMLRAERLVGSRAARQPVLQGDLASHPLWELVQFLQQAGQSGALSLRSPAGKGRVWLQTGKIVDAKWESLPPREALLAIFGLKQGTFRFAADETGGTPGEALSTHEVLMEAAWLEDELEKRRDSLPVSGTPLSLGGTPAPTGSGDFDTGSLPLDDVRAKVAEGIDNRVFDLIRQLPWAPQKIRLAVAWLVEQGVLVVPSGAAQAYPNTSEITSIQLTDMAVTELLASARTAGFGTSALPFLILFESGNASALLELLENVPGFQRNEALKTLWERVRSESSGLATFAVDLGKLALHVKTLDADAKDEIESTVTVSAGVFLWLDEGSDRELTERVVERLESLRNPARGVVVARRPAALELAQRLTQGKSRWQISSHAPQSLLGVFRLIQP